MVKRYTETELIEFAAFYDAHGVVRLPGLIEPEWVQKVQEIIDLAIAQADRTPEPGQALSFGRAEGRMTIRYQWRENAVIRDFLLRDELAATIARIVGSKTLRFWFDLTFIHHGGDLGGTGAGTPWHHDVAAFSFKGDLLPSLWMAMTPTNAELSRLMFIDGSHKTIPGYYRTADAKKPENGEKDGFLDVPDFDAMIERNEVKMITWDCEPGDAIILHPNTIHGAHGNSGSGVHSRRVAITTRWLGDDVRFLPFSYAHARKQLGVVETDLAMGARPHGEWFPLVYDETKATRSVQG